MGAAIYGSRASGGVVAGYFKDGKSLSANYEAKGVASFIHLIKVERLMHTKMVARS
ncbi:MAG: hypothetical protein RIF36_17745 [Imperialibacter sp.]|uniref:hypothetical protein n=1 Tax=Imperialibacter sp. TaxID=2038411 RepID=UPI0032EE5F1D